MLLFTYPQATGQLMALDMNGCRPESFTHHPITALWLPDFVMTSSLPDLLTPDETAANLKYSVDAFPLGVVFVTVALNEKQS